MSIPIVYNDTIIVGCENGVLYKIDRFTGNKIVLREFVDNVDNCELYCSKYDNKSIIVSFGRNCKMVDIDTGETIWSFESDGVITSNPCVSNGVIFFGSWDTYIYSLNGTNGNLVWKYETGWGIDSEIIVSGETLFVGSNDNNFYALNKHNGNLYWYFSCTSGIHSYPILSDNNILFGSDDGRFYNINKNIGNLIWNFSPGRTINNKINYFTTPIRSKPVVYNNVVFIGVNGTIYALLL